MKDIIKRQILREQAEQYLTLIILLGNYHMRKSRKEIMIMVMKEDNILKTINSRKMK